MNEEFEITSSARSTLDDLVEQQRRAVIERAFEGAQTPEIGATDVLRAYYDIANAGSAEARFAQYELREARYRNSTIWFLATITALLNGAVLALLATQLIQDRTAVGVLQVAVAGINIGVGLVFLWQQFRSGQSARSQRLRDEYVRAVGLVGAGGAAQVRGELLDGWLQIESRLRLLSYGLGEPSSDGIPLPTLIAKLAESGRIPKEIEPLLRALLRSRNDIVHSTGVPAEADFIRAQQRAVLDVLDVAVDHST